MKINDTGTFIGIIVTGAFSILAALISAFAAIKSQQTSEQVSALQQSAAYANQLSTSKKTLNDEIAGSIALNEMEDIAGTEDSKRTVLEVAARLINANSGSDRGGAAGRFLAIEIQRLKDGAAHDLNPFHRLVDDRLLGFVESREFINLATSNISTDYYQDQPNAETTAYGDQRLTDAGRRTFLYEIAPYNEEGWIHVATWDVTAGRARARLVLDHGFPSILKRGYLGYRARFTVYLGYRGRFTVKQARLLRDSEPLVWDEPGNHHRALLGNVIGAVAPGTCVQPGAYKFVRVNNYLHLWMLISRSENCQKDSFPAFYSSSNSR